MGSMTALPQGRPLNAFDLDALRVVEDGHRYELVDGSLIVTPAPRPVHQVVSFALARILHQAVPADARVLMAPVDVRIDQTTVLQPDVLVVARADVGERFVRRPLLVVEVLSPSTHAIDLTLKKTRYERAGCPGYWVVDPEGPRLSAWEMHEGRYVVAAEGAAPAEVVISRPFPVRLRLADLLE